MERNRWARRLLSLTLSAAMLAGMATTAVAVKSTESEPVAVSSVAKAAGVAEVNGKTCATLEEAIAAIEAADTAEVTLLEDVYLPSMLVIEEGKTVTLDLNGKAITVPQTDGRSLYAIDNYGTFTLTDRSEQKNGSITARGVQNQAGGTMYMQGGTIDSCDSNGGGGAIWNLGTLEMTGGTLKFSGTETEQHNAGLPLYNEGTVTITGGSLESPYRSISSMKGSVTVENITLTNSIGFWNSVRISGGTAIFNNVTIHSVKGGGIEANGGTVTLNNCTMTQSEYYDWNSSCVAASGGGKAIINGGSYTSENYGLYIFNSGGTIEVNNGVISATGDKPVLKADNSANPANVSTILVSGGEFSGSYGIGNASVLTVTGGTFTEELDESYCGEGFQLVQNTDGSYGVKADKVAEVGGVSYGSLAEALANVPDGAETEVKLLASTRENVVIPAGKNVVLDLNGFTLSGGTNNGSKAALVNNGTVVITDSSAGKTGMIKREEHGTSGTYYVVDNSGTMTVKGGFIYNDAGVEGGKSGSSLIRNVGTESAPATLNIEGGKFQQDHFIVIKNDDYGILNVTGGEIYSETESAVQNWHIADISGGELTGIIWTSVWSKDLPTSVTTIRDGAVVHGMVLAERHEYETSGTMTPEVEITGGTFDKGTMDELWKIEEAKEEISGGSFSEEVPIEYCAPNFAPTDDGNGNFVVKELDESTAAAQIVSGGVTTYYASVGQAVDSAKSGETVTVLKTSTENDSITIDDGRSVTVNLNGNDIGFAYQKHFTLRHGELNFTGKGRVHEAEGKAYFGPVVVFGSPDEDLANYSVVNVGSDVTLEGWAGLFIDQNSNKNNYGIVANVYGTLRSVRDVTGDTGECLYVQGLIKHTEGNVAKINLSGATLDAGEGFGMYLAGYAEVLIENSTITASAEGTTGIEIRAGKLTINNSTVTGGMGEPTVNSNGNGFTTTNTAIAVAQHTTALPLEVTINGGTFTAGRAFAQVTPENNADLSAIQVEITGGEFIGEVYAEDSRDFVSGGAYSEPVDKSYLDNLNAELYSETKNPDAPYSYYATVEDALAQAGPNDTVTDLNQSTTDTYTVTLNYYTGKTEQMRVNAGTVITLPENPTAANGKDTFLGWYTEEGDKVEGAYTVTADVTFTARWKSAPVNPGGDPGQGDGSNQRYAVTVARSAHGTVSSDTKSAPRNRLVTLTATPDAGYVLETLTVENEKGNFADVTANGDGTYSFRMPGSNVTVRATFVRSASHDCPSENFVDVNPNGWYHEAIDYVLGKGMMNGTGENTFEPDIRLSRGMIAQVLYNLEGRPAGADSAFTDVAADAWYADAVNWAAATGIVGGYGDGTFGADDPITREQMAQIIYRYAGYKNIERNVRGDLSAFTDGGATSDWATTAMEWAVGAKVLTGREDGSLDPTGTATRAEVAQILMNFCETVLR